MGTRSYVIRQLEASFLLLALVRLPGGRSASPAASPACQAKGGVDLEVVEVDTFHNLEQGKLERRERVREGPKKRMRARIGLGEVSWYPGIRARGDSANHDLCKVLARKKSAAKGIELNRMMRLKRNRPSSREKREGPVKHRECGGGRKEGLVERVSVLPCLKLRVREMDAPWSDVNNVRTSAPKPDERETLHVSVRSGQTTSSPS